MRPLPPRPRIPILATCLTAALLLWSGCATPEPGAPTAKPAAAKASSPAAAAPKDEVLTQAEALCRACQYDEAQKLYEGWLAAHPDDAEPTFDLGYTLYLKVCAAPDAADAKAVRLRARDLAIKARKLGSKMAEVIRYDEAINPDGTDRRHFSIKPEVEALMQQGEQCFTQGKYDDALVNYQAALKLDPQQYDAALFSGDTYFALKNYWKANLWFERATEIDPNRETAYRYWADSLLRQERTEDARDRYIEAFVAEPYNRYTQTALDRFAVGLPHPIHHPAIKPWEAKFEATGKGGSITIGKEIDVLSLAYGTYRAQWHDEHPTKGTKPRHSLAEEAFAIREMLKTADELMAKDDQMTAKWRRTIDAYKQLEQHGWLEAYLLYEGADEGIAQDYDTYRNQHRDVLIAYIRQVWFEAK